ncbi:AAA family ATPase [Nocardia terpenica]|uniref:ATPase AAA-type core domain-containing protein n=1 Tax=Nocardia terpenica TaxID=455432 RepID=A0A291RTJ8_9NOCA|nr:ATP-binding protein [Nocardia terpenica]ATL70554.1 hypothetical protein CRH09_34640 [Nocardia terpenica]
MLLSFRVTNHRSLREEQQLLLTPTYPDDRADDADWEAVPVAGIFGANASGKTNVLDALVSMRALVLGSLRDSESRIGIHRHPFSLDTTSTDTPSTYVVDLLIRGVRYTYGVSVDDSHVTEEWLHTYPHKRKREIFHRVDDKFNWGDTASTQLRKYADDLESNVLFLSVAGRFKVRDTRVPFEWFVKARPHKPFFRFSGDRTSNRIDNRNLDRISALLRAADTGIDAIELIEERAEDWSGQSPNPSVTEDGARRRFLQLQHRGEEGALFPLLFRDQSFGTQALTEIGVLALDVLAAGSILIVDEIDRSMHTFLTAQIIGLFRDPETNPNGAQLIFSSHDSALLGRIQGVEVLDRDHVWFTEKDECGATELFPISAFKPRKEDNLERRYLSGRYGAVPIIKDELFAAALSARENTDDATSAK